MRKKTWKSLRDTLRDEELFVINIEDKENLFLMFLDFTFNKVSPTFQEVIY